jgi:hypothetical protein
MTRTEAGHDADSIQNGIGGREFKSDAYPYEIVCSTCARSLFVDSEVFAGFQRRIESGFENQFVCDDCQEENEESAFDRP